MIVSDQVGIQTTVSYIQTTWYPPEGDAGSLGPCHFQHSWRQGRGDCLALGVQPMTKHDPQQVVLFGRNPQPLTEGTIWNPGLLFSWVLRWVLGDAEKHDRWL